MYPFDTPDGVMVILISDGTGQDPELRALLRTLR
jgi:hypothetical protein